MSFKVRYSKPAQKEIKKLPPQIRKRIKLKLEFFYRQKDPLVFAEKLIKSTDAQYRWRIGVYRIVFDFDGELITILRIQHRREVYRK